MIRIIGFCDKCNSSIKEYNNKIICNCGKKISAIDELNKNKPLTKCLNCGEMFDFGDKKIRKNSLVFCSRCLNFRKKEQMRIWYESHKY